MLALCPLKVSRGLRKGSWASWLRGERGQGRRNGSPALSWVLNPVLSHSSPSTHTHTLWSLLGTPSLSSLTPERIVSEWTQPSKCPMWGISGVRKGWSPRACSSGDGSSENASSVFAVMVLLPGVPQGGAPWCYHRPPPRRDADTQAGRCGDTSPSTLTKMKPRCLPSEDHVLPFRPCCRGPLCLLLRCAGRGNGQPARRWWGSDSSVHFLSHTVWLCLPLNQEPPTPFPETGAPCLPVGGLCRF